MTGPRGKRGASTPTRHRREDFVPAGDQDELSDLVDLAAPRGTGMLRRRDIRKTIDRHARSYLLALRDDAEASTPDARATMARLGTGMARIEKCLARIERLQARIAIASLSRRSTRNHTETEQAQEQIDAEAEVLRQEVLATETNFRALPNMGAILTGLAPTLLPQAVRLQTQGATGTSLVSHKDAELAKLTATGRRLVAFFDDVRPGRGMATSPAAISAIGKLTWDAALLIRGMHGPGAITPERDGLACRLIRGIVIYATGDADNDPVDTVVRHLRGALAISQPASLSPGWGLRALQNQLVRPKR